MNNKKREYKQIIRESLINGGYLKKPSFQDKLDEIIEYSFEDLDILLKKQKEEQEKEDEEIIEIKDINELTDEEIIEYEKCLPSYISDLPGSLRSTDPKELQKRLDTIDKRLSDIDDEIEEEEAFQEFAQSEIDDATERMESAQKNLDDYHEKEDKFNKDNEVLQGEALDESNDIRDDWEELTRTAPEGAEQTVDNFKRLDTLMRMFGVDEFEHKGVLYGDEADALRQLADEIETYSLGGSSSDVSDWSQTGVDLADNIRDMVDKYDVNKHPLGDDLTDLMGTAGRGEPSQWESDINDATKIISRNRDSIDESVKRVTRKEKEKSDLEDNRGKTEDRLKWAERREGYNVP